MDIKEVLCFDDVMLVPNYSKVASRKNVVMRQDVVGKRYSFSLGIPLIGAPMDTVVGSEMARTLAINGGLGVLHRYNTIDMQLKMIKDAHCDVIVAISASKDYLERLKAAYELGVRIFCVDVAHGNHEMVATAISEIRKLDLDIYIMAGNVADWYGARTLIEAGTDCIRTSVGSGAACSTRIATGFGIPTLAAVMDIAEWARYNHPEITIMADGGIRNSGDAVKAMVAGAHFVMCGSLLAGTTESPGTISTDMFGNKTKTYRGMASIDAMCHLDPNKKVASEGITHQIKYKGSVQPIIDEFIGGIQSGCSYAGVNKITDLYRSSEFVKISQAGLKESLPHIKY